MADIRINQLPAATGPTAPTSTDNIAIDGTSTRRATIQQVVDTGAPISTRTEAQAGTNATKRMTPLTTKQSIAAEVGVTLASAAQGALADSAVQPGEAATPEQGEKADGAVQKDKNNVYIQDTLGAALKISKDNSPLNYGNTRAGFVFQHRDALSLGNNLQVPGAMFQFNSTGDGYVVPASKYSGSIWWGLTATQRKSGDGSAHAFTAVGELSSVGAVGYNECGLFQGQATNIGSSNGNLSGIEVLCSDGTNALNFATQTKAVIGRVGRFNLGGNAWAFYASSEGNLPPDAILAVNPQSTTGWLTGLDLSKATFTTGNAILVPNNSSIASQNEANSAAISLLFLDGANRTQISFGGAPTQFGGLIVAKNNTAFSARNAANSADVPLLLLDASGVIQIGGATSTVEVSNRLTLTGEESAQLSWRLGAQQWRANMASGGNWYIYDFTNNKFPLTIVPNAVSVNITTTGLTVAGAFSFNPATTTTAPAAGGAGTLPASPLGYATVNINGTDRKIAYYA